MTPSLCSTNPVYAFRARTKDRERDVLVMWTRKEVDWNDRGVATAGWKLAANLNVMKVLDYLGRSLGKRLPEPLPSAPVFVRLPAGGAMRLLLEPPLVLAPCRDGSPSPVMLRMSLPSTMRRKVEDLK